MRRKDIMLIALVAMLAALTLLILSCSNPKDPVDSQAPTVAMTSPADGSVVPNTVDILADAEDNVGVTKVEFYIDAELYFTDQSAPWACCWSVAVEHDGEHTIFAKAFDDAGNWDCSEAVTVNCAITPPATITDLAISIPDIDGNATLTWTAPGDDGTTGTAAEYDLRYYWTDITTDSWSSAIEVDGEPTPQAAGGAESYDISDLMRSRLYYFAIRTRDAAGNWSDVSPSVTAQTADLFEPAISYAVGNNANDLSLIDINGDSHLDLVVLHESQDSAVYTMYNDGNGVFAAGDWCGSYAAPSAMTPVDIDNDNDSDLVVTTSEVDYRTIVQIECEPLAVPRVISTWCGGVTTVITLYEECDTTWDIRSVVSTFENLGGGVFQLNHLDTVVDTTYNPCQGLIMPCLPGMGPEVNGMCCYIYYNTICDNPGYFAQYDSLFFDTTIVEQWAGHMGSAVTAADFNNDGFKDMAITNFGDNNMSILNNAGNGKLLWFQDYEGRSQPGSVCHGDFNNDGFIDVVMAASAIGQVSAYINFGDGTFNSLPSINVPDAPTALFPVDCNDDGNLDVVMSSRDENVLGILFGNGNGTFAPTQTYQAGRGPSGVCAADFDGDDAPDLAVSNENGNDICVLLNQGLFLYYSYNTVHFDVGQHPIDICAGDIDGDGDNDLVVLNDESNEVSVLFNAR